MDNQVAAVLIADKASELRAIFEKIGKTRELSLAITKLDECVMWAQRHFIDNTTIRANELQSQEIGHHG